MRPLESEFAALLEQINQCKAKQVASELADLMEKKQKLCDLMATLG